VDLSVKYYIRPRAEENIKLWQGPYDSTKLKELAERRLFSKELHEYSEDRLNWISARQIWPTLFPKAVRSLAPGSPSVPLGSSTNPLARSGGTPKNEAPIDESEEWYCAIDGAQQGPLTLSQLQAYLADSRLQPTDLVWCPALGDQWVESQTIPELFQTREHAAGVLDLAAMSGKVPPLAVASLICGALGMTCLVGIGSILAIIFGHVALSQYDRLPSKNGRWMAVVGLGLGYASTALVVIGLAAFLALRTR
jgi:Domain of unknown function (DUF4190)/GYF domain 2